MTAPALDPISRRILQLLAADGRASYQAIADEVGLSRPAVMERVKRLEEAGFIRGYPARLDRTKAGFPDHRLRRHPLPGVRARPATSRGSQALATNPNVLECHHVAGDDCYILKVAAPSLESLEGVLRELKEPGHAGEHPHHDRALHRVREAGHRPGGERLIWRDFAARRSSPISSSARSGAPPTSPSGSGCRHLPPLLFAGVRFLIAGLILAGIVAGAWATGSRAARGTGGMLAITGVFLLLGGNAVVVWAEQFVESGAGQRVRRRRAALGRVLRRDHARRHDRLHLAGRRRARARLPRQRAPRRRDAGRAAERRPRGSGRPHPRERVLGARHRVLQAQPDGDVARTPRPPCRCSPAALVIALLGLALGEAGQWHWSAAPGLGALAYLVVFGSIVGYTATPTRCAHASATIVGTYAYVNPVVAVLLGWLILHEAITAGPSRAMVLILGAVLMIQLAPAERTGRRRLRRERAARSRRDATARAAIEPRLRRPQPAELVARVRELHAAQGGVDPSGAPDGGRSGTPRTCRPGGARRGARGHPAAERGARRAHHAHARLPRDDHALLHARARATIWRARRSGRWDSWPERVGPAAASRYGDRELPARGTTREDRLMSSEASARAGWSRILTCGPATERPACVTPADRQQLPSQLRHPAPDRAVVDALADPHHGAAEDLRVHRERRDDLLAELLG